MYGCFFFIFMTIKVQICHDKSVIILLLLFKRYWHNERRQRIETLPSSKLSSRLSLLERFIILQKSHC